MSSSAFFMGIVAVIGVALAILVTPILFIPVGLIVLLALLSAPILAWWTQAMGRESPHQPGTPSTSDATYDPVDRPQGLTPRGGDPR